MSNRPLLETKEYTAKYIDDIIMKHAKDFMMQPEIEEGTGKNCNRKEIVSISVEEQEDGDKLVHILYRENMRDV